MRFNGSDEDIKSMDIYITNSNSDVRKHPSYDVFIKKIGTVIDHEEADKLWLLMMQGFRDMRPENGKNIATFKQFAKQAGEKGLLNTGDNEALALWTGGYAMSLLAQEMGHCTLEKTVIGKLLDTTKITTLWNIEKELWNEISKEFVNRYKKNVVHIYFRTLDDASVLLRQEVPQLKLQNPNICIYWHPIYNNRLNLAKTTEGCSEVGLNGRAINIDKNNRGFDSVEKAGYALQEMLKTKPYSFNEEAYKSANYQFFDPNRAPFALYG